MAPSGAAGCLRIVSPVPNTGGRLYDDIDPIKRLPPESKPRERYDRFSFLCPWEESGTLRQLCHELGLTPSVEFRKFIARFNHEHKHVLEATQ
jgi:hypothetical protein